MFDWGKKEEERGEKIPNPTAPFFLLPCLCLASILELNMNFCRILRGRSSPLLLTRCHAISWWLAISPLFPLFLPPETKQTWPKWSTGELEASMFLRHLRLIKFQFSFIWYIEFLCWPRCFSCMLHSVSVVVGFWSASGSRHKTRLIRTARNRRQDMPADHFSQHYSAVLEVTPPSRTTPPRELLILWTPSWAPPSRSRSNSSRSKRDIYNNRPHWSSLPFSK